MYLSKKDWDRYIKKLSNINNEASKLIADYIEKKGVEDIEALLKYSYEVTKKYSTASAAMNAMMYDRIAELEGVNLPPATLAASPTYGDVAKSVQGTLKTSQNPYEIGGAVGRLVKMTGQDTMLDNALRDRAEYAWIPVGETCAFCITLAANGWQPMSKAALENGHAQHIHSNCDCSYMVRHTQDFDIRGYQPLKYKNMYDNADTSSYGFDENRPRGKQWQNLSTAKINGMRREFYAENKAKINAQKASAEEKRKELNSSKAEETNVN